MRGLASLHPAFLRLGTLCLPRKKHALRGCRKVSQLVGTCNLGPHAGINSMVFFRQLGGLFITKHMEATCHT